MGASKYIRDPLLAHVLYVAAAAIVVVAAYYAFYAKPGGAVIVEAEDFIVTSGEWAPFEDVNFSGARGVMTYDPEASSEAFVEVKSPGRYFLHLKYYGNYAASDLNLWNSAYTNSFGYIDYNNALTARTMTVAVDGSPPHEVTQKGSHRYAWARVELGRLDAGVHRIALGVPSWGVSAGSVNVDAVLLTNDPTYSPGDAEALPRQISEYFSVLLVAFFPIVVWLMVRRERAAGPGRVVGRVRDPFVRVVLLYSVVLSLLLSVMWIDTDGGFWIWLTQSADFTPSSIYTAGDALHHRYVYPPPVAMMLIALRPVFTIFGAMDGITVSSLLLSKAVVIPMVAATGVLLARIEGRVSVAMWALNSVVIFTVAANSMYFGLAFLLTLCIYFIKGGRHYAAAAAFGCALAYMNAAMLMVPPFLLCLRGQGAGKIMIMAALALVPGMLVLLPHLLIDPVGTNARLMNAGISSWMSMHLGLRFGDVGLTPLLYGALMAFLWLRKPALDYVNVSMAFALTALIYLHVGAPYFLAWTVAFQPMVIIVSRRFRQEVFYGIYVTTLMVWASFYLNTGGADDRAGETGFFPYYVFYTWPFDVYSFIGRFYERIAVFSKVELEVAAHSLSVGVSVVLFLLIMQALARRTHNEAAALYETAPENRYE